MRVEELVEKLRAADLVALSTLKKQIVLVGPDAIPALLDAVPGGVPSVEELVVKIFSLIREPEVKRRSESRLEGYLDRRYDEAIRAVALSIIESLHYSCHVAAVRGIALDRGESLSLRKRAFQALPSMPLSVEEVDRVLEFIGHTRNDSVELVLFAMKAVESFSNKATPGLAQDVLEGLLTSEEPPLRARAIELLGLFGDLDVLERVCMLPRLSPEELKAVHILVNRIAARPRNLVALRPEHFEIVIKRLLETLRYRQIELTQMIWDGGIDLRALKDGGGLARNKEQHCIIQCKRYQPGGRVDATTFRKLQDTLQAQRADLGVLITTSAFTSETQELAKTYKQIELIDGEALQGMLDDAYGKDTFCIRPVRRRAAGG